MRSRVHPAAGKFGVDFLDEDVVPNPIDVILAELTALNREVQNIKSDGMRDLSNRLNDLDAKLSATQQRFNISSDDDFLVYDNSGPLSSTLDFSQEKITLGFRWKDEYVVTILAGNVRIMGMGTIAVAETDITLSHDNDWVYVEYAVAAGTTTVKVSDVNVDSEATLLKFPLFKFTKITANHYKLTQVFSWGDIVVPIYPDSLDVTSAKGYSIGFNSDNFTEIAGWDATLADAVDPTADNFLIRKSDKHTRYSTTQQVADAFLAGPWTGANAPWLTDNPPEHSHLADIVADTAGDDHDGNLSTGNFPYVSGRGRGTGQGNRFAATTYLEDDAGVAAIAPGVRVLKEETTGDTVLAWDETGLLDASSTIAGGVKIASGLAVAKKLWALEHHIDANNGWTASVLNVHSGGNIHLHATSELDLDAASVTIDGTACTSVASIFTKGLFIGTGTWQLVTGVYLYDNNGVVRAGPVDVLTHTT